MNSQNSIIFPITKAFDYGRKTVCVLTPGEIVMRRDYFLGILFRQRSISVDANSKILFERVHRRADGSGPVVGVRYFISGWSIQNGTEPEVMELFETRVKKLFEETYREMGHLAVTVKLPFLDRSQLAHIH